jgi:predicted ATPase
MANQPVNGQLYGPGITRIAVTGFKSLAEKTDVKICPLTVLAGANSSGKSSLMQPLLLMKQTFDNERIPPGPFWLRGEQVGYDTADQFLSKIHTKTEATKRLTIELEAENNWVELSFEKKPDPDLSQDSSEAHIWLKPSAPSSLEVVGTASRDSLDGPIWRLNRDSSEEDLELLYNSVTIPRSKIADAFAGVEMVAHPDRCFLGVGTRFAQDTVIPTFHRPEVNLLRNKIQDMIHVSGLRGSNEREFYLHGLPLGSVFPGDFEEYVPSILEAWKDATKYGNGLNYLYELRNALQLLELASGVETRKLNESKIEVLIPRTLQGDPKDLVNIADVGLAVSQILPVLVALILAHPNQLVHIEQPELHLHPRAQWKLAQLLASAANRGVRLVIETHSSLLLQGILTGVAKGAITPDKVALHWFTRSEDGITKVTTADLDAQGRFGDWPADFDDVELAASDDYLDAMETKSIAS